MDFRFEKVSGGHSDRSLPALLKLPIVEINSIKDLEELQGKHFWTEEHGVSKGVRHYPPLIVDFFPVPGIVTDPEITVFDDHID